jgi:hypothetical protein
MRRVKFIKRNADNFFSGSLQPSVFGDFEVLSEKSQNISQNTISKNALNDRVSKLIKKKLPCIGECIF